MKICLAINSNGQRSHMLGELLDSSSPFDEIWLYVNGVMSSSFHVSKLQHCGDRLDRNIVDGFNYVIKNAIELGKADWICSFCDDDVFHVEHLKELIGKIKSGEYDDADIVHFPVYSTGGTWGALEVRLKDLEEENRIPHGSFFRREVFEKLGGYKIEEGADWNFWLRAMREGFRFKCFENPVYYFRQHSGSAFNEQLKRLGGFSQLKQKVLANA